MADFMTRIELHQATSEDYDVLHTAMTASGFANEVMLEGAPCRLPTAEYYCQAVISIEEVHAVAKHAADSTGRTSSIIVCEAARIWGSGLTPI